MADAENGFGNSGVKCALLIRRMGQRRDDLHHFVMPFTWAHA